MNRFGRVAVFSTLSAALLAGPVFAQDHDDHRDNRDQSYHNDADHHDMDHHDAYVKHEEWKHGYHMKQEDWSRAHRVDDWKADHLRRPPRGYEWREVDGNYVLADVNTGIINTVVAVPLPH